MQRQGLTTRDQMRAYFTGRIVAAAKAHGRRILGWDEVLSAGLDPSAAIMSWHGGGPGKNAAVQGHDVVMSPSGTCYLDHYQAGPMGEPPAHGGALVMLQTVYGFDPMPAGLTAVQAAHVLGPQGNLWSEYVPTEQEAEYMAFPRALAVAEIAWSARTTVDYAGFVGRVKANLPHLDVRCVRYAQHF
jgi:hexosaminidase